MYQLNKFLQFSLKEYFTAYIINYLRVFQIVSKERMDGWVNGCMEIIRMGNGE